MFYDGKSHAEFEIASTFNWVAGKSGRGDRGPYGDQLAVLSPAYKSLHLPHYAGVHQTTAFLTRRRTLLFEGECVGCSAQAWAN